MLHGLGLKLERVLEGKTKKLSNVQNENHHNESPKVKGRPKGGIFQERLERNWVGGSGQREIVNDLERERLKVYYQSDQSSQ